MQGAKTGPRAQRRLISAIERRRSSLTVDERKVVERAPGFWDLVEAGYVSYRRTGAERSEIGGGRYVGRAAFGDFELQVREKVSGTVAGLIDAATGVHPRAWRADSRAADFEMLSMPLIAEFLAAAEAHVAHRRPRYEYKEVAGPVLSGTLDIARTMRLQATGRFNWFAYREGRLVRTDPLDRLVLFALLSLERVMGQVVNGVGTYRTRRLAAAFADARDAVFSNLSSEQMLAVADGIASDREEDSRRRDLARLAAVVILHQGFDLRGSDQDSDVPRAWFLDLETLFERAVSNVLRDVVPAWFKVDRGQSHERRLFVNGADRSRTYPDIAINRGWDVIAVGDVKYKDRNRSDVDEGGRVAPRPPRGRKKESRSDLYQLLVHAASLRATQAFLVYPSDQDRGCRYLGLSSTGCHTWTLEVRPSMLHDDLVALLGNHLLQDWAAPAAPARRRPAMQRAVGPAGPAGDGARAFQKAPCI